MIVIGRQRGAGDTKCEVGDVVFPDWLPSHHVGFVCSYSSGRLLSGSCDSESLGHWALVGPLGLISSQYVRLNSIHSGGSRCVL